MEKRKIVFLIALAWFLIPKALFAKDAADVIPSTGPAAAVSTSSGTASSVNTSSAGVVASSVTIPDRPMTERPGKPIFISLTRSAYPADELPTSVDIITPSLIQQLNAHNVGEAIAQQASVQTLPIGQLGSPLLARIRGGSSDQTLVLVDGRPVEGFALGAADLTEIPVESIDHIEILRGGVSALYGPNAMGGVINVITQRATYPGKPISNVDMGFGAFGEQFYRLNVGSRYGPLDYFFYGDQQWEGGMRDNQYARTHNLGGNAGISMGEYGKLLFDMSSYHNEAGVPGMLNPDIPTNQYNNSIEQAASLPTAMQVTDNNAVRASYLLPLPADALMALRLFGSQREVAFNDAADPNPLLVSDTDRHEESHGSELQFTLPRGLTVGGNFIHDREDHTDMITPANTFIRSVDNWGVFGQEEYHWEKLTLIPSGRFDHNSQAGESKNPRVQSIVDATPWLRFSGSAGRSFRAPMIDELYFVSPSFNGNPSLRPETAWLYDGGFEVHQDSISFRATYYRANVTDLIQLQPITFNTDVNIGDARRQGAELQLDHTFNKRFKDSWNYTYLENEGMPTGFDHFVPLALSPRHTVNYLTTIVLSQRWKLNTSARYEDSRFTGNDQTGEKLGSELLLGLRFSYQWRQMEVYAGVNDLNNKRYEEQPGFPLPGRTTYAGLSLRLWE